MMSCFSSRMHNIYLLLSAGIMTGIICTGYQPVYAQYAGDTIKGTVEDQQTGEPLEGAIISTLPATLSTSSDENGSFELQLEAQVTRIIVQYMGYRSDTLDRKALGNPLTVSLQEGAELEEVLVEKRLKSTEINMLQTAKMEHIGGRELAKAACCNLSESFETTPSIDVGFTDAVSGYKQISMLGLAGANTLFTRENIPDIRGLAAITGLSFTPGAWVESMQLSKGSGSVVNGFEGAAGQINVEWMKPFEKESPKLLLNGYQSIQGRSEGNVVYNHNFNEHLSSNLLLHGKSEWMKVDQNHDGFLDQPMGQSFIGANRWMYFGSKGLEIQAGIKGIFLNNNGGQSDYAPKENNRSKYWGYENEIYRAEAWAKIGKVYIDKPWKSMGLQLSGVYHDQNSWYGLSNYNADQRSFYANYIYQSIIGNTNHVIKGGASLISDHFTESFGSNQQKWAEVVPGIFTEYTYTYLTRFSIVAGLRADYHNIFGAFITPRLHIRYAPRDRTVFRASIGRAQRTSYILADNQGLMASGRIFEYPAALQPGYDKNPYGLQPEIAWNTGVNFTQKFILNYRDGAFSMDYYYTDFSNQAVVDLETPGIVRFYNLQGKSYAHSFQAQLDYEPIRKLDVRLAYRFYDVKTTYNDVLKEKPLIAAHRAFANIAYETRNKWKFDYTVQWVGAKRLPLRFSDASTLLPEGYSDAFVTMNAQVSKSWKKGPWEVYLGGENLTGLMQHHMILDAENPFSQNFDASLIWGPGMGRNVYIGFRYKL